VFELGGEKVLVGLTSFPGEESRLKPSKHTELVPD